MHSIADSITLDTALDVYSGPLGCMRAKIEILFEVVDSSKIHN